MQRFDIATATATNQRTQLFALRQKAITVLQIVEGDALEDPTAKTGNSGGQGWMSQKIEGKVDGIDG